MSETMPLVSISCITYNHAEYIRQTLDGFVMQKTDFPFEILIHDDASTDETQTIIREYESKFPGLFRPIYQIQNQYSQGNTNINYDFNYTRARGKYIAYCEGDDYWTDPYKLQKQVDYMEEHPECSLCFHAVDDVNRAGEFLRTYRPYKENRRLTMSDVILAQRVFPFLSFMFRAETIKRLPDFYFQCPIGDLPMILFQATQGYVYYQDCVMASYRNQAEGSWSSRLWGAEKESRLKKHIDTMKTLYRNFDEYTESKYRKDVETALKRQDFAYIQGIEDFRGMLQKEYRDCYRELPWMAKVGYVIGAVSPVLYHRLKPDLQKSRKGKNG